MTDEATYSEAALLLLDTEKWRGKSSWFKHEVDEFNREVRELVKDSRSK